MYSLYPVSTLKNNVIKLVKCLQIRAVAEGHKEGTFVLGFEEYVKFWCPERKNKINLGYYRPNEQLLTAIALLSQSGKESVRNLVSEIVSQFFFLIKLKRKHMHQDLNFGSSFENSSLLEKQGNFLEMRACVAISIREAGFLN